MRPPRFVAEVTLIRGDDAISRGSPKFPLVAMIDVRQSRTGKIVMQRVALGPANIAAQRLLGEYYTQRYDEIAAISVVSEDVHVAISWRQRWLLALFLPRAVRATS